MENNRGLIEGLVTALVVVIIGFFVMATAYLGLLRPGLRSNHLIEEENAKKEFLLSLYDRQSQLVQKLVALEPLSDLGQESEGDHVANLMGQLTMLAKSNHLEMDQFEVLGESREANVMSRVSLAISVTGFYNDEMAFLNSLYRLPILVDFSEYTLSLQSGMKDGRVNASIRLDVFYLDQIKKSGDQA